MAYMGDWSQTIMFCTSDNKTDMSLNGYKLLYLYLFDLDL